RAVSGAEARREVGPKLLLGMDLTGAGDEHAFGLRDVRIGHAAVDRTDRRAGLVVVEPDALGALLGHDVEDLVRDRGPLRPVERIPLDAALVDRRVRALGLAGAAVDALV